MIMKTKVTARESVESGAYKQGGNSKSDGVTVVTAPILSCLATMARNVRTTVSDPTMALMPAARVILVRAEICAKLPYCLATPRHATERAAPWLRGSVVL
ncbi:Versiconal hemiacetal acetate esterase [Fusarium oxysporum f. sp. albedinis]|nr:Versiconal hemiacetal acetate esterase [Fusarium oxysporum f. sp. albedinis]